MVDDTLRRTIDELAGLDPAVTDRPGLDAAATAAVDGTGRMGSGP